MSQRICSKCREAKPLGAFHRAKDQPQGRHRQCKDCRSELGKAERLARGSKQALRMALFREGKQRCSMCDEVKPLDDFYKCTRSKTGRKGQCIDCYNERGAEHRSAPEVRDAIAKRRSAWTEANPEEARRRQRKYALKKKYGLSLEGYEQMLARQRGCCAICHRPTEDPLSLFVDHCHASGKVRGLLCQACNSGIGMFEDDVDRLREAIRYLSEPVV